MKGVFIRASSARISRSSCSPSIGSMLRSEITRA